jgi:hypothetical protein
MLGQDKSKEKPQYIGKIVPNVMQPSQFGPEHVKIVLSIALEWCGHTLYGENA